MQYWNKNFVLLKNIKKGNFKQNLSSCLIITFFFIFNVLEYKNNITITTSVYHDVSLTKIKNHDLHRSYFLYGNIYI